MDGITTDWEPENYAGFQPALLLGRLVYSDLVYAGARSWGYWKAMEVNGNHALISLFPSENNLMKGGYASTNKMLWVLGNYSFFIRPGYKRIGVQGADDLDTLVSSAYLASDNSRIVVVFVNSSFDWIPVSLTFMQNGHGNIKKVSGFRTDDRHDLARMNLPEKFRPGSEYTIPPRSVITMVFEN